MVGEGKRPRPIDLAEILKEIAVETQKVDHLFKKAKEVSALHITFF
jgi:hypothetical protein